MVLSSVLDGLPDLPYTISGTIYTTLIMSTFQKKHYFEKYTYIYIYTQRGDFD